MRFAAGLTVSGILGFLLLEALKIVMVPVTAWIMGLLALVLKIVLVGLGLMAVGIVVAVAVFVYRRTQRKSQEV
jgi:hypothetical protein